MAVIAHRYTPRGTALQLFGDQSPEILMSGPAGSGKSRACLEKLHAMALANPGMRGLIVRKTLSSLGSTALVTWREHVAREALAAGVVSFYGGSPQTAPAYVYANGSSILVGGMDKATRVMSSEFDAVYAQEAIELTVEDWEAIVSRLRNGKISFQQIIADTNPAQPTHWLKQRCDFGSTKLYYSTHEENPLYFDLSHGPDGQQIFEATERGAAYLAKLDRLTGVRYQRLRKGLWVAAEGLIYEDWDPAIHLVDRLPDGSESWVRWWAVDFGYTNPTVIQCWAEDPDGRLWLYRELYRTGGLVEDHVREMLAIVRPGGEWIEPRPRGIVADHDAEDRATFERHSGMRTLAAKKEVSPGIQAVQARLRKAGDGRPRVYVVRDCLIRRDAELADAGKPTCFVEEITGYVWAKGPDGKAAKEAPEKMNDHSMDCARYVISQADLGGRPGMRTLGR